MSANAMNIEDVYTILNDIHAQVTGKALFTAIDPGDYVSVATTILQQGTDVVYNALMNTITKTIFSTRPYSRQFGGLIVDNAKWGGIVRKVQFGDTDAVADRAFTGLPADGQTVDHYMINRGDVLETRYYGSAEYQDVMTVFRDQLINAFDGPEQLGSFVSAKANEVNNKWIQWTEDLARGMVANAIYAKSSYDTANPAAKHAIHLISAYNAASGQTITMADIFKPAYAKPFWEFVRATIKTTQREFTNRNILYYENIAGHNIVRHTPFANQKVYLSAAFMDMMETSTLAEAFNDEYLKYADYEGVSYWTNPTAFTSVIVAKNTYLDYSTGQYVNATTGGTVSPILGLIFDEDFMNINIKDTIVQNTPMNARGLFYNTWLTAHAQYCTDFTEKGCLLMLD